MEIVETLNKTLLQKNSGQNCLLDIEVYKAIAFTYSQTENSIAVLSDMQLNKSWVYSSKTPSSVESLQVTGRN